MLVWRAYLLGYRRGYRRGQAELRHEVEAARRETRETVDHLRKANAKSVENLATVHAVRREIARLRAIHGIADEERSEVAPQLH